MPAFIVDLVLTVDSPPLVIGLVADHYDPNARPVRDNRTASLIVRSQLGHEQQCRSPGTAGQHTAPSDGSTPVASASDRPPCRAIA